MNEHVEPAGDARLTQGTGERSGQRLVASTMSVAMLWNLLSFTLSQASGFVVFLILAAKLSPELFGIVALASLAADFVAMDGRSACMDAIMQMRRYDQSFLNSAFAAFFAITCVIAFAIVAGAPMMASWSEEPLVGTLMPAFALLILPVPWLSVMDALLMRDLHFRRFTERNIVASLLGGVAGVAWTFTPFSIWALVVQRFVALIATVVLEYSVTRWRPGLDIDLREGFRFLRRVLALWSILTLTQLTGRAFTFVFGLRYDAVTVGLTRAAGRIVETVQVPLVNPLMGLWFPIMSKVRGEIAAERGVYNSIIMTSAFLAWPTFLGLALVADDVTALLLPERYAGAAPLMQAMCLARLLIPIFWFNTIAMTSLGMNRLSLCYSATAVVIELAVLVTVTDVSAPAALLIAPATTIVTGILGNRILNRKLQQSNAHYYGELFPPALAGAVMVIATLGLRSQTGHMPIVLQLAASASYGVMVYAGWLWVFHRSWWRERIAMLRGRGRR